MCKIRVFVAAMAFSIFFARQATAATLPTTKKIILQVGELKTLHLENSSRLDVSRRGTVDVFAADDGYWQLIGLRKGLVLVSTVDDLDNVTSRLLVEVRTDKATSSERANKTSSNLDSATSALPDWLCKPAGIRCDQLIIRGTAPSPAWLQEATVACKAIRGCVFLAHSAAYYKLSARILLLEEAAAKELGFDHHQDLILTSQKPHEIALIESKLQDLQRDSKIKVLSEPVMRLLPERKSVVLNGGEFQVLNYRDNSNDDSNEPVSSWKRHGLKFSATVTPLDDHQATLDYDIDLRSRVGGGNDAVSINAAANQVLLTYNTPQIVSLVDLKSKGEKAQSSALFSKIPLIGPLFDLMLTESSQMSLAIWFNLTEEFIPAQLREAVTWPEADEAKLDLKN